MRLLLLLSVLLSALSGAGVSARAPGVAQAVAGRSAVAATVAPARRKALERPQPPLPTLRDVLGASALPTPDLAPQPLWASRRRE